MILNAQAFSYIGRVRAQNEDSFLSDPAHSVFAVADGVGGVPGGALASQTAMARLKELVSDEGASRDPEHWVREMNEAVRTTGRDRGFQQAIASTVTLISFDESQATLAQVGDSAAYLIRDDEAKRLTDIHNIESENRAKGEPVDHLGRYRFAITRCLGMKEPCIPQIRKIEVKPDDLFLLATDGLTDLIEPYELLQEARRTPDPEALLEALRVTCFDRGAHDNVTAIAIRIESVPNVSPES